MWFCCSKQHVRKIYPEQSYNWYVSAHPETSQKYDQRLVRCQQCKNPYQFEKYARTKIKSKNLQDIYMDLRNRRDNFVDDDFPHVYPNIAKDGINHSGIGWKRVGQLIKNAVYSLPKNNKYYLSTFKSNNKALQTCLTLISRTHPKKLQRIRNRKTSQQGIYQFKLFKNGIIHNVIVDDYVPFFNNFYVFTGPANDVQVYPMLLEKAIAKISGGYSEMPKNPLQIMEMIYCGAIRRENLDDLKNLDQFEELVTKTLGKQGLTILIAKKDKKIRQYGINDNQIYHIINQYPVKVSANEQNTLYQILSQSKMSAWNGCFRITDPAWKQVDPTMKDRIFASLQTNHSFTIVDKEIYRVFEELIVYEDTETMNKDWLQNYSESGYPSFCRFGLKQKDTVFLRITTQKAIRQSIILCKVINQNEFQLVGGNFDDNTEYLDCHLDLQPGEYIICVIQDWVTKKEGEYIIYLSSTCRTVLVSEIKQFPNFLQKMFVNHSLNNNPEIQTIFYHSLKQIGFGYLRVFVKQPAQIKKIKINHKKIQDQQWKILQPYSDMPEIVTTSEVLIVMKMLKNRPRELSGFPIQAFIIS